MTIEIVFMLKKTAKNTIETWKTMEFTIQKSAKRGDFPSFFVCFAEAKSMAVAQAQANKHGLYP
jgi:hypothetical protein